MSRLRLLALLLPSFVLLGWQQPADAQAGSGQGSAQQAPAHQLSPQGPSSGIRCVLRDGVPTTVSLTRRGEVPIIRWTSGALDASGWTPEKRCEVVSQRFEAFRSNGQLKFLTSGRVNGLPVICALPSQQACQASNLLYTLKPGQDPNKTLELLLAVRRGASGALMETPARIWVNFNLLLDEKLSALEVANPQPKPGKQL